MVIDGYTVDSTQSSPASLPLGTALVLVCRVSGIPQRQIKYNWTCPDGPCERPEYVGRKVVNPPTLPIHSIFFHLRILFPSLSRHFLRNCFI